jgi:hypothetical protein
MVIEVRSLLFTDFEILEAMTAVMRRRGESVPGPQPVKVRLTEKNNGQTQMQIDLAYDGQSRKFDMEEAQAALTAFCIRQKIPMPRLCHKSLEWRGEQLALIIRLNKKVREAGQRAA